MRRRKVGTGGSHDPMHGAAGNGPSGTHGPYFGNGGRGPQAGPNLATSPSRFRKVGGGNLNHFSHVAGPTAKADTVYHGAPQGGTTGKPHQFDVPHGSSKRHRKIGGPSGQPYGHQHNAYVGPGGMNGSSSR